MSERVIVRCYGAGVFFGELGERSKNGKRGVIKNARRLWYWEGAASLSQLAVHGVQVPKKCKFPVAVSQIEVTDIVEVLSVTEKAAASIDAVEVWSV